jgi:UDP-N-acetyl-D-mannosaminuronic acid dehydrogenase
MRGACNEVAVYGLGYVGLTLAVSLAEVGYRVAGLEIREDLRAMIASGEAPFIEPGLAEGMGRAIRSGHLAVLPADGPVAAPVHIVTVGTPMDESGRCRLDMVAHVSEQIANSLLDGDLVCLRSTVMVGTTRDVVLPQLLATGKDFRLAFTPERTLEGDALRELRSLPQIVGGLDQVSEDAAASFFGTLTSTVIRVTSLETAELVKLTDNAYRDVRFAFSNEVAAIAGAWGVSGDEVLAAARLGYPRTSVADAGPVGGPCLSKDSFILAKSAEAVGESADLAASARRRSASMIHGAARDLDLLCPNSGTVAVLGLAFKGSPPTDDTRGSASLDVVTGLLARRSDVQVRLFDPCGARPDLAWWAAAPEANRRQVAEANSWQEACHGADVVFLGGDHASLLTLDLTEVLRLCDPRAHVLDFWSGRRNSPPMGVLQDRYRPWYRSQPDATKARDSGGT